MTDYAKAKEEGQVLLYASLAGSGYQSFSQHIRKSLPGRKTGDLPDFGDDDTAKDSDREPRRERSRRCGHDPGERAACFKKQKFAGEVRLRGTEGGDVQPKIGVDRAKLRIIAAEEAAKTAYYQKRFDDLFGKAK